MRDRGTDAPRLSSKRAARDTIAAGLGLDDADQAADVASVA